MKTDYIYELRFKVRDYECDSQGIVNNANYLHYMEHTRHEFLESLGVSFMQLQQQRIDPVVSRVDIHYKYSLSGGDEFRCRLKVDREGPRVIFTQEIRRITDDKLCSKARVDVVILKDGELTRGDYFDELLLKNGSG